MATQPLRNIVALQLANVTNLFGGTSNIALFIANTTGNPVGNTNNWIGISHEAITSGSTGRVTVLGGVNESVSGLTPGSVYYVTNTGPLTTTAQSTGKVGQALSATSILIGSNSITGGATGGVTTGKAIAMAMIFGG